MSHEKGRAQHQAACGAREWLVDLGKPQNHHHSSLTMHVIALQVRGAAKAHTKTHAAPPAAPAPAFVQQVRLELASTRK
jgi:hypothetical protein